MSEQKPNISYAICVWNEHKELALLLAQLFDQIDETDQIVVQGDQGKVTPEVVSVLHPYKRDKRFQYVEYPLKRDFSSFKNNLIKNCTNEYIFLIDADELLSDALLFNIKDIIFDNQPDCIVVPRKNIVYGITPEYAAQFGWKLMEVNGEIINNFPDQQKRIFRNKPEIRFESTVHEQLIGMKTEAYLPYLDENRNVTFDWCILHYKSIERQVKQNNFYNNF